MVVPNGPAAARAGSTWIHCGSSVAAANASIRSCVTSIQELRPEFAPHELAVVAHATEAAARRRSSEVSRPRSSRLSYSPGDTRDPVTATRIGRYTVRGFSPSSSQSCFSATSISAAVHGSTSRERCSRSVEDARVEQRRVRLDVVEQEAREVRELVETADLLLDDRGGGFHALRRPVAAALAEVGDEPRRVLLGRQAAQVHPVHPVELRVVEGRGTRADALERETCDELVARHDRRLAVRRPAE